MRHPPNDDHDADEHSKTGAEPLRVGDKLPAVCGVGDVARVLGVSLSRVHQMRKAGQLRIFLLHNLGDGKARYSGKKLQQWLDGELEWSLRYFGRARTGR